MGDLHRWLGLAAMGLALALLVAALGSIFARRDDDLGGFVDRIAIACVVLVAVTGLVGLATAATAAGPRDILHVVYGLAALVVLPLGMALGLRAETGRLGRRRDAWIAAGGLVLALLGLRLLMTG